MVQYKDDSFLMWDSINILSTLPPKFEREVVISYSPHLRISQVHISGKEYILRWLWFNHGQEDFNLQCELMSKINHPNIERQVRFFKHGDNFRGVLTQYVDGQEASPKNWQTALHLKSLKDATLYLHSINIVHNDISPKNIMIGRDGTLVLIDFDSATYTGCQNAYRRGTTGWHKTEQYGSQDGDLEVIDRIDKRLSGKS
ncbi:hypothetical protein GGF37_000822 [Kickxella alabastrina]|nr:hypothetical protein GGF37_000822 [Kickxella alabastrina]